MMHRGIFLMFFCFVLAMPAVFPQSDITVVSYNIWFDNPGNAQHPWAARKAGVIESLQRLQPDVFCVQEALANQVHDLEIGSFRHAGVGRDDGKRAGEFSAIFYDTTRFINLEQNTFWLSAFPDSAGVKGWDAVCVRIATWVHLKEINTGKTLYVFNTHFDHMGENARLQSAYLIKKQISLLATSEAVILTGDFNCKKGSMPYNVITSGDFRPQLNDARYRAQDGPSGPDYSYIGSDFTGKPGDIIDHIFVSDAFRVLRAGIAVPDPSCCPSDHLPVVAQLLVR